MLLAHWLAYVLSYSDPHARAHVLGATGHGYWVYGAAAGLAAATLAFGTLLRSRSATETSHRGFAARLAIFQVMGFVLLEGSERLLSDHGIGALLGEPVLWIGIALQVLVAVAGALLVRHVARLVGRARRPVGPRVAAVPVFTTQADISVALDPESHPLSRRGPPVLV